ncbi:MAG: hypothetical protein AAF985_01550 [Bacteroidota bacterium]
MKKVVRSICFCILLNSPLLQAQMISTQGPVSGGLLDVVFAFGDTAFVDINANPWRTFDGGQSWEMCQSNLPPNLNPDAFTKRGNTIYMGTNGGDRLYKTTDFGDTWTIYNTGLPQTFGIPSAVPTHLIRSGDRVFIGGTNFGIQYTDLNDESWIRVNESAVGDIIFNISVIGEDSLLINQGNGWNNLSYFSKDNGDTWTMLDSEALSVSTIATTGYGQIGNRLVAVLDAGGVNQSYYSDDFGQSWILSNNGPAVSNGLLQVAPNLIFAYNFEGIYQTNDGINWTLIENVGNVPSVAAWKDQHLLYGVFGAGLFDIDDYGQGTRQEQQIAVSTAQDLFVHNNALYCLTDRGIYTYQGNQWQTHSIIDTLAQEDIFNPGNFFDLDYWNGSFYLSSNNGYFKSSDSGYTFTSIPFFAGERIPFAAQGSDYELVAIADGANPFDPGFSVVNLFYYNSNSAGYEQATVDGALDKIPYIPTDFMEYNGVLYVSGGTSTIYQSEDAGKSWTSLSLTYNVGEMVLFNNQLFFSTYSFPSGGLSYTSDGFASRQEIDLSALPRGNQFLEWWYFEKIFVADDQLVVYLNDPGLIGSGNGFYALADASSPWTALEDTELPASPSFVLDFQNQLYAGVPAWSVWTDGAITSSTHSASGSTSIPKVFPNPASTLLNIPNPDQQAWIIYDLRGTHLLSGQADRADIQQLPPGTYLLYWRGQTQIFIKN